MAAVPPGRLYNPYPPPPATQKIFNLLTILGMIVAIVGGVICLLAALIGGTYLLLRGVLALFKILGKFRSKGTNDDNDDGGEELELAELAQLPPAPRHDPRLGPAF